jgi:chromosomal replication initiation ATPase DnaA
MCAMSENVWALVLERLRATIEPDEFRRWLSATSQASDSGDQITIWVPASADGRHISVNYLDRIHRELEALDRHNINIRFVATGYEEDEEEAEE